MANVTISETKDGERTVVKSEQHNDYGEYRPLPRAQMWRDEQGNELRINFMKIEHRNITFWANSKGKPTYWSIENLKKDEKNPMSPWCEVESNVTGVSHSGLSISSSSIANIPGSR